MEYIILALIGLFAYLLAYRLVGNMYDKHAISGSIAGSIFHWLLRFILFVSLWGITNAVISVYRFIAEHWETLLTVLGGAFLLVTAVFLTRHFAMQNSLKPDKETIQKS